LELVLQGEGNNRSRGLVGCIIMKSGIYDHKRHYAKKRDPNADAHTGEVMGTWHFWLLRDDGTTVGLHPNWSNTKVSCYFGELDDDDELPRCGPGGSSGSGTYKHFKEKQVDAILKFDAEKKPLSR
jgi:hypothetical protein